MAWGVEKLRFLRRRLSAPSLSLSFTFARFRPLSPPLPPNHFLRQSSASVGPIHDEQLLRGEQWRRRWRKSGRRAKELPTSSKVFDVDEEFSHFRPSFFTCGEASRSRDGNFLFLPFLLHVLQLPRKIHNRKIS